MKEAEPIVSWWHYSSSSKLPFDTPHYADLRRANDRAGSFAGSPGEEEADSPVRERSDSRDRRMKQGRG